MNPAQDIFRAYISLRAKAAAVMAVVLCVLAVGLLANAVSSSRDQVNRLAFTLQITGVIALIPVLVGGKRSRRRQGQASAAKPAERQQEEGEGAGGTEAGMFLFYRGQNLSLVVGSILGSLTFIWLLVAYLFLGQTLNQPGEWLVYLFLALVGFAWLNLFMGIHLYLVSQEPVPPGILAWFFTVDLPVSIASLPYAGLVYILIRWLPKGLRFIFLSGFRRVALIVTVPCFLAGLFFEFLATFL